ncbi:MAG: FtsL-like putative cell division protein [Chitinophagaceae bacterium]
MQAENKIKKKRWKQLLQYQWIVKHVPFFLFLTLLAVIYIANGHFADKTIRNIAKARAELKQLQYQHKVLKAEVMYRSKESVLVKAVEDIGLKRLTEPPLKITDSTSF